MPVLNRQSIQSILYMFCTVQNDVFTVYCFIVQCYFLFIPFIVQSQISVQINITFNPTRFDADHKRLTRCKEARVDGKEGFRPRADPWSLQSDGQQRASDPRISTGWFLHHTNTLCIQRVCCWLQCACCSVFIQSKMSQTLC